MLNEKESEKMRSVKKHIAEVDKIAHTTLIPIKLAVEKYMTQHRAGGCSRRILEWMTGRYKKILMVQKIKNKWMCSNEKLEVIDFNII